MPKRKYVTEINIQTHTNSHVNIQRETHTFILCIGCLNSYRTYVTANNPTNNNVSFFFQI